MDLSTTSRPVMAGLVAATLIAIPSFVVVALLRVQSLWTDALVAELAKVGGQSEAEIRNAGLGIEFVCSQGTEGLSEFCSSASMVQWALIAAYVCLALAVVLVALPWIARKFIGEDRARLGNLFGPVANIMAVSVGVLITVQALIGSYAFYMWEVEETGRFHPKLILIGVAGVAVGAALFLAAVKRLKVEPSFIFGVQLEKQAQPRLVAEVEEIGKGLGAMTPDNIVVGVEPNFFVTSAPVKLLDGTELKGRTLFLSLPLMRLFKTDEFRAVVGHELSHFKGSDTEYSLKFAPAYSRLSNSLATAGDEGMFQTIAAMPLAYTLREFAETERTIGRQRELLADKGAASVASPGAIVRALIKVATHGQLWSSVVNASETKLADGVAYTNLSELYADAALNGLTDLDRTQLREVLSASRMSHPTDTHPTLAARAEALGCTIDAELDAALAPPDSSSTNLLNDIDGVEESATLIQHRLAVLTGRVIVPQARAAAEPAEA